MRVIVLSILMAAIVLIQPVFGPPEPTTTVAPIEMADVQDGTSDVASGLQDASGMLRDLRGFFTENLGQVDNPEVRFYAEGKGLSVGLTLDGLVLAMRDGIGDAPGDADGTTWSEERGYALQLLLEGHTPVEPVGEGPLEHSTNSFVGNEPSKWVRGARSFEEVWYRGLYNGIDLRFYFREGTFKYDLVVSAGADAGSIGLRYFGATDLAVDPQTGDLVVTTPLGVLRDDRPVVLWDEGGAPGQAAGGFILRDSRSFGFALPDGLPRGTPFTIDPGLVWSTYLGGSSTDVMYASAVDREGNVYAIGRSDSTNFPTTTGAYNTSQHQAKGIITKFDPTGSRILYSTFFGGSNNTLTGPTISRCAEITPEGYLAIAAMTSADDCPTTENAVCGTYNRWRDIYFLVMGPSGDELVYATYYGGSEHDRPTDLVIDGEGSLVIIGDTRSRDFPTSQNAFCATINDTFYENGFVLKLDRTYERVLACTYIGGRGRDLLFGCDVDTTGDIYITGGTVSRDYPTTEGAYCRTYGGGSVDGFLSVFDPYCTELIASTLYGGNAQDDGCRLHLLDDNRVCVLSEVSSPDFPTTEDAQYRSFRGGTLDSAISIFDRSGSTLLYSSYFGGSGFESVLGSAHRRGTSHVYFNTRTSSTQLPTTRGCYDPAYRGGTYDQTIIGFNLSSYRVDYCTYVGGSRNDDDSESWGDTLSLDEMGRVILAGTTLSLDFPTTMSATYRAYCGGGSDGFLLVLDPTPILDVPPAPTGLIATYGNHFVELMWDRSTVENYRIPKYQVYRSTTPKMGADTIRWSVYKGTTFNDTAAENGRTYYYWVTAFNSVGESQLAGPVLGHPMGPPTEPRSVKAVTGNGKVRLTWEPPDNMRGGMLLGYQILRGADSMSLKKWKVLGLETEWEDSEVEVGKVYFYGVRAFNEVYAGEQSAVVGIKVLDVPGPPLRVELLPLDRGARISWQPPIDTGGTWLLGYSILQGSTGAPMTVVATLPPSQLSAPVHGLVNGIEYQFQVAAFNEVGLGRPSETLRTKPIGTPTEPLDLVAERGDCAVHLSWNPPANDGGWAVDGYVVYAGSEVLLELDSVRNETTYLHTGLRNGEPVYYAVAAYNKIGTGTRSAIAFALPLGPSEAPSSFIVQAMEGKVKLSWYPPTDTGGSPVLAFRIYRSEGPSPMELLEELSATLQLYWDFDVMNGMDYAYRIVAVTELGEGDSSQVEHAVPFGPPGPPTSVQAEPGDRRVKLSWDIPENDGGRPLDGYCIYRGTSLEDMRKVQQITTLRTWVDMDKALENGVMYLYGLRALNEAGEGAMSSIATARLAGVPGIPPGVECRVSGGLVNISWQPPTDDGGQPILGYVVLRGRTYESLVDYRTIGTTTGFVDTEVELGGTYYYTVKAVNIQGEGDSPSPRSVDVPNRVAGGWYEEASALWSYVIVALTVVAVVALIRLLLRNVGPAARASGGGGAHPWKGKKGEGGASR